VQFQLTADEPNEKEKSQQAPELAQPTVISTRRRGERRTASSPGREEVIDIAYVFRNSDEFQRAKEKLQAEVTRHQQSLKEASEEVAKLHEVLARESERGIKDRIENEIARKKADIEAGRAIATKELRQREAEVYQKMYERIADEVARYAKANDIRIVRRADLSSQRDKQADDVDPQEIIKRLNQDIVYIERDAFDITDAILERLSASDERSRERGK
jgi:Skp family chaperone for outer membrane proteins